MKLYRYRNTTTLLEKRLAAHFGELQKKRDDYTDTPERLAGHMLWMIAKLQKFPTSIEGAAKAGQWIGWLVARAEFMGIINRSESIHILEEDLKRGFV